VQSERMHPIKGPFTIVDNILDWQRISTKAKLDSFLN
jgi:hypothetical protein